MLTDELLRFVQQEKNISMEFVERARGRENGVYLYGAGVQKLHVIRFLEKHGVKICAILDTFQQGSYQGIPIIRYSEFLRSAPDPQSWFVISAPTAEKEIRQTLEQHFPGENIFFFETTPYVEWIPDVEAYRSHLLEHWDEFSQMHDALADEQSRETLVNIIKGRISGKTDYFRAVYVPDTYYPKDIIRLSKGEVLAEVGSYDGLTLLDFLEHCPDYKAAYCFEPDPDNLRTLTGVVEKVRENEKITIIPKGAWDCRTTLSFSNSGGATILSHVSEDDKQADRSIETVTVDETISEPITYMKVSINGMEERAIRGAGRQIAENRPKLAIWISHNGEPFLNIWNYLRELVPEYRFYLRHHLKDSGIESYLYAV